MLCFCNLYKGDNFCDILTVSMDGKALPKCNLLPKEKNCSKRSKFISLKVEPTEEKGKTGTRRVATPATVTIDHYISVLCVAAHKIR